MEIPLACDATAKASRISPYLSDFIPAFSIMRETLCTALTASEPVISANLVNAVVASSSSLPVKPNRVLTSPSVEPMDPRSPTTFFVTPL